MKKNYLSRTARHTHLPLPRPMSTVSVTSNLSPVVAEEATVSVTSNLSPVAAEEAIVVEAVSVAEEVILENSTTNDNDDDDEQAEVSEPFVIVTSYYN